MLELGEQNILTGAEIDSARVMRPGWTDTIKYGEGNYHWKTKGFHSYANQLWVKSSRQGQWITVNTWWWRQRCKQNRFVEVPITAKQSMANQAQSGQVACKTSAYKQTQSSRKILGAQDCS
jgi:hypothetical protein